MEPLISAREIAEDRAIASQRPVILLDEPVAHLDHPTADAVIADLLQHDWVRWGGGLMAAAFLREFVGGGDGARVPWAHVDIAGPSFNEGSPYGYTPAEGTGAGVRTLLRLLEDAAADRG